MLGYFLEKSNIKNTKYVFIIFFLGFTGLSQSGILILNKCATLGQIIKV